MLPPPVHREPGRTSLIVEFIGNAGSGKTTLAESLATRLRAEGYTVHTRPPKPRWQDLLVASVCQLGNPAVLRLLYAARRQRRWLLRQCIVKPAILRRQRMLPGIHLRDQGAWFLLTQVPPRTRAPQAAVLAVARTYVRPDVLVSVDAPGLVRLQRWLERDRHSTVRAVEGEQRIPALRRIGRKAVRFGADRAVARDYVDHFNARRCSPPVDPARLDAVVSEAIEGAGTRTPRAQRTLE